MNILIVGAGAMGSWLGARLSTVAEVWLLDPWREHVETIRAAGLRVRDLHGEDIFHPHATTDLTDIPQCELAIILVKSHQTEWAAQQAAHALAPDGLALTLQNGLGNREVIARVLKSGRAWQGVTSHGATRLGAGRVRHAGAGPTYLETRPEIADRAQVVAALFERAGLETHLSPDLASIVWGKLLINVGINALTAILRVPNGALLESPSALRLMEAAVAEGVAVAQAKSIVLADSDPAARVRDVCAATVENHSSMLQDILRGSPTEVDVINGAIVREGMSLGIVAPVNEMLVELVEALHDTRSSYVI